MSDQIVDRLIGFCGTKTYLKSEMKVVGLVRISMCGVRVVGVCVDLERDIEASHFLPA